MSKHKKEGVTIENIVYTNTEAETLITTELEVIGKSILINAIDLAEKELPKQNDSLKGYGLFVQSIFQCLLEKVHKHLGAKRSLLAIETATVQYEKESQEIQDHNHAIKEDLRLLNKQEKQQNPTAPNSIRNYHVSLCLLALLCMSEVVINYKIFLPISTNSLTALIGAIGIGISLAVICHVYKDILALVSYTISKWLLGGGIITFIILLLFSFAELRLSYYSQLDTVGTQHLSSWNFVMINLTLLLSGIALTFRYKPSLKVVAESKAYKKLSREIQHKKKQHQANTEALTALTKKHHEFLDKHERICYMAHYYEKVICGEYKKAFAMWHNENLIIRKDNIRPKAFGDIPPPLNTYFENLSCLTKRNHPSS